MTAVLEAPAQARPRYCATIPEGTDLAEAHKGAEIQGLPMTPQGEVIAGVLNAVDPSAPVVDIKTGELTGRCEPLHSTVTVEVPRRSTKTTSIQNVLLGRCMSRPGYRVVSTAQDGTRASQFFMDMVYNIDAHMYARGLDPQKREDLAKVGISQVYRSQGREFIMWLNGSKWWVVKPEAGALRGGAADVIWFDEAGELDPDKSAQLEAGALPVMDTRPEGQVIISGTPGLVRAGLFWSRIALGRENPDATGLVDYCAGDLEDPSDERVWWRTHPGLTSGLTRISVLRKRWETLDPAQFAREYLCIWPPDTTQSALSLTNWDVTATEPLASPPPGCAWGIGFDVAIGAADAAVAVAWFDEDGDPHVQVMDQRAGAAWLVNYLARANMAHPRVPIAYDSIGDNLTTAQALQRVARFKAQALQGLTMRDVAASTATLAQAVDNLAFYHATHKGLDAAVRAASWRESGGNRLFMRRNGISISALLACVAALAAAAKAKPRARVAAPSVSTGS